MCARDSKVEGAEILSLVGLGKPCGETWSERGVGTESFDQKPRGKFGFPPIRVAHQLIFRSPRFARPEKLEKYYLRTRQ